MHVETIEKKETYKPIRIIIDSKEEAFHLLYRLCFIPCPSDPLGIESVLRHLIEKELKKQGIDLSTYAEKEERLSERFSYESTETKQ